MPDYFTLEDLRAYPDMQNAQKYSSERCEAVAAAFVQVIEREVDTSFIPRQVVETHDGDGTRNGLQLKKSYVRSIVSVTENGSPVTDQLSVKNGWLRKVSGTSLLSWSAGFDNIVVTLMAGYSDVPPDDVKEWSLKGTRAHLLATAADAGINDRRTSQTTEFGVINFLTAGPDQPTGYPEVDAMILGWKRKIYVPKVA